jgi:hypothetical protein
MVPVPLSLPDTLAPVSKPQILKAGGEFVGKSAKALALLYSLKSVSVSGLHIADHSLDGCAQLMRCYGGTLTDCTIERISHVNGVYKPGIGRGIFLSANTTLTNLTIRNVVYQSGDPITNPGDVYGGITLGGKDANDIGSGFLFEDLDFRGLFASSAGPIRMTARSRALTRGSLTSS